MHAGFELHVTQSLVGATLSSLPEGDSLKPTCSDFTVYQHRRSTATCAVALGLPKLNYT